MAAVDRAQEPRGARPGRHPFFWVAAALGLLVLGFYAFAANAYMRYGETLVDLDWSAAYERGAWYVTSVEPGGPADGLLRAGDRIRSVVVEGPHPDRPADVALGGIRAGDVYRVRVEREGQPLDIAVAAPATIDRRMLRFTLSFSVVSLAFYVVALLLGLRRPDLWIGRLGCVAFLVEAVGFASMPLDPIRPFFAGWERTVDLFVVATQPFQPVLAYHFFRSFPKPMEQARVWRALTYVLYAAALLFVVPNVLIFRQLFEPGAYRFEFMSENTGLIMAYFGVFRLYLVGGLVAAYAVLIRNYFAEESDLERRRIKWVVYATAASVIPFGALHAADFVAVGLGYRSILANVENFGLLYVVTSAFVLIPLSIGYAILKHRIFDIHVVVRLGVRYLLARGVLEATLTLPVALLAISIMQNPELTVAELFRRNSVYLYLIIGVVVSLSARSRLGEWVDRMFFRAAYDREQILVGLVEEIKERDSIGDISRHVSAELEAALHPSRMILLFRQEGAPRLMVGYSSGERAEDFLLAEDAQLMYVFAGETDAQDVPAESDRIPEHELHLLHDFGITLVVPMTGSDDQIVGLLLLGEKRSEEPYSPRDRSLLEAVAAQMAIVYENSQLKTRVARDRRIRVEVLGRIDSERINLLRECPSCGTCYDSAASHCAIDAAELTLTLPVERTIDGKYRLDRLIGRGGMGAVYEGTDLRLERRVAVKIMTGRSFGDRDALRRFQREARASARLSHPNIVQIYDYGTLGESGAYLVLELLRGRTLRQLVVASGCLTPRDAARLFEQIFDGMHAAHAAGVVHRDLKPENVLVVDGECVKILDFGLAKMTAADVAETSSITVPGTIMGTFGYMSPEQLNGAESDGRADIFALGVMLYEALTGRKPFAGRNWGDLLASIANGPAPLPGGSPEAKRLEALLGRCLAEEPAERFPSVAEARDALIPAVLACEPFCEPTAVVEDDDAAPTAVLGENAPRV